MPRAASIGWSKRLPQKLSIHFIVASGTIVSVNASADFQGLAEQLGHVLRLPNLYTPAP